MENNQVKEVTRKALWELIKKNTKGDNEHDSLSSFSSYYGQHWNYQGFLTSSLAKGLITSMANDNQAEIAALIARADLFVADTYLFQNEWDMERTSIPEYLPLATLDWDYNPQGDPEWTFMLNRQAFLVDVAIAYQLTNESKYIVYLETFIEKWLTDNPLTKQRRQTSWRTIDVALRVANWVKVLEILLPKQQVNEQLLEKILISLHQQLLFLTSELSETRGQSNWAVIEVTGIIIGSLAFPELPGTTTFIQKALKHLTEAIRLQVEADGMQREQSFMYHHEVLISLMEIIVVAKRNKLELDPFIGEQSLKMAQASALFVKPDGFQSNYGDSDHETMIGLLGVAEAVFEQPFLTKALAPVKMTLYETLFLGNNHQRIAAGERLDALPSAVFEQAGLAILRDPENDHYTLFKCGPLGGGHGHDDQLHVELYSNGETFLVDSGRYSYECEHHNRLAFKEGFAHNTVIVDQQNFNQHHEAWETTKVATPINQKFAQKGSLQFAEGGHLGYVDLADPVLLNRKVIALDEGIWFISDEITCQKEHEIEAMFHFRLPQLTQLSSKKLVYQGLEQEIILEALSDNGSFVIKECPISLQYNSSYQSQKAIYQTKITGNHVQSYVIHQQGAGITIQKVPVFLDKTTKLTDQEVECYRIESRDKQGKYLLIQHQEPSQGRRAYLVEDKMIYGRVVLLEQDNKGLWTKQTTLY